MPPPEPVDCDGTTCQPLTTALGMLPPCCSDKEGLVCGAQTSMDTPPQCTALMQPGTDDPTCPTEMSVAMTALAGCCIPGGMCGVRSATLMGCIERSEYPIGFLMGMPTTPLASMACGGGGDGGAQDGGADSGN